MLTKDTKLANFNTLAAHDDSFGLALALVNLQVPRATPVNVQKAASVIVSPGKSEPRAEPSSFPLLSGRGSALPSKTMTEAQKPDEQQEKLNNLEQLISAEFGASPEAITRIISDYSGAAELGNQAAAIQLAQFYQVDHICVKKDLNLAVAFYLRSAMHGNLDAVDPLERLCEEMDNQKKSALSHLFGTFFKNNEKADYWRTRSMEIDHLKLKIYTPR